MYLQDMPERSLSTTQDLQFATSDLHGLMMSSTTVSTTRMLSLAEIARDDHKFLAFDAHKFLQYQKMKEISSILDQATTYLQQFDNIRCNPSLRIQAAIVHGFTDQTDFDKFLANIEHMMKCIQYAASNTLIHMTLHTIHSDPKFWNKWFQQTQNRTTDWFSEWSSDRPPLNSTMPWNIKASLVVLWGVCWMFYTPNKSINSTRHTSEESWYNTTSQGSAPEWVSQTTLAGSDQVLAYSNPTSISHVQRAEPLLSHTNNTTSTTSRSRSLSARLGTPQLPEIDMIGQMTTTGYHHPQDTMSQHSPALSHMNPYSTPLPGEYSHQATPGLDSHKPSIASTAALRSPLTAPLRSPHLTTSTATDIGPAFATHTGLDWSLPSHHNPHDGYPTQDGIWISQPKFSNDTSGHSFYPPSPPVSAYVSTTVQGEPLYYLDLPSSTVRQPSYGATLNAMDSLSERNRRSHSVNSQTGEFSPNTSGSSPRNSVTSVDPPRDGGGNMTCDHPKCSKNPPIFSRKCEWKKHKDTHTRPYVCRVPGCEKIQGFTYSGGLLRHEREVHHQHGGPKLPRYCPHKDCKRSTGQGFSRKENLNEHLRRVHLGVGIDGSGGATGRTKPQTADHASAILSSQLTGQDSLPGSKRKRNVLSGEEDQFSMSDMSHLMNTVNELREEVNSLRQEVAIKDARISYLQNALHMQTIAR